MFKKVVDIKKRDFAGDISTAVGVQIPPGRLGHTSETLVTIVRRGKGCGRFYDGLGFIESVCFAIHGSLVKKKKIAAAIRIIAAKARITPL